MTDHVCYSPREESIATEESYAEGVWWVLHHSDDPERRTIVLTCYLDESGTDNNSTVAVVGGLILKKSEFFWLDQEWRKTLERHGIPWPLHMKEFGEHGKLKDVRSEDRRALFIDLVRAVNENKTFSVASTLDSEQYLKIFAGVDRLSMYGASFLLMAMVNGTGAQMGGHKSRIAYLLDCGNRYSKEVLDAHSILCASADSYPLNVGAIGFDSDDNLSALQAADMVSWAVRRRSASELRSGFEPLADLFDERHIEVPYQDKWMESVAGTLRARSKE